MYYRALLRCSVALLISLTAMTGCIPSTVNVPDLVGLNDTAAETALSDAGLTLGTVTEAFDSTVPARHVISQSPVAGTSAARGALVDLVVSKGPQPVSVPSVVGESQAAAETAISNAGLTVGAVTEAFSDTVPSGQVISQDPAATTSVLPGTSVDLLVSKGPEPVSVPNVVGETQAAAETAITNAGLTAGAVTEAFSDTVPSGQVIGQDPPATTSVLPGTSVDLVVSKGPEPVSVPNVVGETQAAAEMAITSAGLAVGTVTEAFSDTVQSGQVISQDPAATTNVLPGTAVDLVVSKGPEPVAVPNVVGQTQSAAEGAITGAGLTVGTVTEAFSDTVSDGQVISQDPAADMSVPPGTAIDLVVSKGPEPVPVPNLSGLARAAAETAITGAGLSVGSVTEEYHSTVPEGQVVSQSPAPDEEVAPGSAVDFVVSLGLMPGTTETVLLPGGVPLEIVWVPAGTFLMGAPETEQESREEEYPQHEVTLTEGFWLGKYVITKEQWYAVMQSMPWEDANMVIVDSNSPAMRVSWNDAQLFIAALNAYTGMVFGLPTEAEWEYACRAGTTTRYYWGDDPNYMDGNDYAWWQYTAWEANERYAHVVGQKLPNAWGLYDMTGNVWEWVNDWLGDYPATAQVDPTGPETGTYRILRGGAFGGRDVTDGGNWRSARRAHGSPGYRTDATGFRVAR